MMLETGICTSYFASPLGWMKISASEQVVTAVLFSNEKSADVNDIMNEDMPEPMQQCIQQLKEYFEGSRQQFNLPLLQKGTTFQQAVWNELTTIPFGSTISYLQLSKRLGNIKAIRAAAASNGKNKIAIIIPCHRVIGTNNDLVGYAGGLIKKRWLLEHEIKIAHGLQTLF